MNILILEDTNTFVEEFVDPWHKRLPNYFYRCSFK